MPHALLVTVIGGSILYVLFWSKSGRRNLARAQRSKGFAVGWMMLCLVTITAGAFLVAELSAAIGAYP